MAPKKRPQQPAAPEAVKGNERNHWIFVEFKNDLATITEHEIFKNIVDAKPLTISTAKGGGGNQVPFTQDLYETAMKSKAGAYKCGGNIFWLDQPFNPNPGTPLSVQRIKDLKEFSFSKPSPLPLDVIVAVPHDKFNPMEHRGALQSVTPVELLIGFAQAVAEAIRTEEPAAVLNEWRNHALTCTMVFEVLTSSDQILSRSLSIREKISSDFASLCRTPFQRVYEIWHFKQRKEEQTGGAAIPPKKLAEDFNALVKLSKISEPVVPDYVSACIMVYEKAFKHPEVQSVVAWCDEMFGVKSPFDSVYKMQNILRKCKDKSGKVVWIFQAIIDQLKAGIVKVKDLTSTLLFGSGGRSSGWVDMWIMKNEVLYYLTKTNTVQKFCFPVEHLSQIDRVLQSFENYRKSLHPYPVNKWKQQDGFNASDEAESEVMASVDLTWQSGWSAATLQFLNFCEDLVYGVEFDSILKTACRGSKTALDVFEYPTIQARLNDIKALRDKELDQDLEKEKLNSDSSVKASGTEAANAEVQAEKKETMDGDDEDVDDKERREVERMLQRGVTLFVEPPSQSELKEALLASRFKDIKGDPDKSYVLIVYDYKQASESQTRPHTRVAPLRDARIKSMVQATLDARRAARAVETQCIMPGDMWMFFDGSRPGHHYMFNNKLFVDEESGVQLQKVLRQLRIEYLESSVAERRAYCRRAVASLKSNETAYIITNDFVRLPQKKKKHFSGTNLGSSLVEVPLASAKETWKLQREAKKDIYGKYQVAVGGKESDAEDDDELMMDETTKKQQKVDPREEVPVFYWQPSSLLCDEILHMYSVCAIIDLTAGSGQWALAALKNNIPYFGVVLTPSHLKSLREWLITAVLRGQQDETSAFFNAGSKKKSKAAAKPTVEPKTKKKSKPEKEENIKKKRKTTKKKKKGSTTSEDSSASSSESPSDSPM